MLTSVLHTLKYSSSHFSPLNVTYSPFENCNATIVKNDTANNITTWNIIDDGNSFWFVVSMWILSVLGILHLIFEYVLGGSIGLMNFIIGPYFYDLPKIKARINNLCLPTIEIHEN